MGIELQALHHPEGKHLIELFGLRLLGEFGLALEVRHLLAQFAKVLDHRAPPLVGGVQRVALTVGGLSHQGQKFFEEVFERC